MLRYGIRNAITIRNEAMPAQIAVVNDVLSGSAPVTTEIATSHAMTTPNASAAELRSAACLPALARPADEGGPHQQVGQPEGGRGDDRRGQCCCW